MRTEYRRESEIFYAKVLKGSNEVSKTHYRYIIKRHL